MREVHCLAVSPWKCTRLLKALDLNHRQIVEAALIRAEAVGRTESHAEIAMKDQAERFPTVVASHGFTMRQMSSLALHLRSPFPRLRKTNAKTFAGFPTPTSSKFSGPAGSTDDFLNSALPFDKFDSERSTYVGGYAVIGDGKTFAESTL
jgi:hypothetical protein